MQKGKPIHKGKKKFKKAPVAKEQEVEEPEEQPKGVQALRYSYIVNAIEPQFTMGAFYTGGRILCGKHNIYAACDNTIVIYDPIKQSKVDTIVHTNEQIVNFCLNHSQTQIVTFSNNYLLRLIDLQTRRQIHCLKINKYYVIDMAFSHNNKFLALGCVNSFIKILTVSNFKQTHEYKNHRLSVRRIQWHPDPNKLQVASLDQQGNFIVFDYLLNQVVQSVPNFGLNFIFTNTGKSIISCGREVNIWDYKTCKLQKQIFRGEEDIETLCLIDVENEGNQTEEFGKTTTGLLFGGEGVGLTLVGLRDGVAHEVKGLCEGPLMKIMTLRGQPKKIIIVSYQQNVSVVGYTHNNFSLEATLLGYNDEIIDVKFSKTAQDGHFSPQSQLMVVATNSSLLKLVELSNKNCHLISGHKDIILCVDYSYPYIISSGKDKVIKFWRIDHHSSSNKVNLIANYKGHSQDVTSIVLLPNSQKLASVSQDKTIKLWLFPTTQKVDIKSSSLTVVAHDKSINAIRANHNETLLASCSQDRSIKIWDASTLQMKLLLKGHKRSVWDVAFNKIEKILASVAGDGTVKIWNLTNGECVGTMGEGQPVLRVQWLFHNQVVTGTLDGMVRVWDVRKMTSVVFDKHEGKIWALEVSAMDQKGDCIITSGANDSKIILWKDVTEEKQRQKLQEQNINQQDKFIYSRYISERNYVDAARIAFESNLTQMFIKAVQKLLSKYNSDEQQVRFEQNQLISDNITQFNQQQSLQKLTQLVQSLIQTDLPRLLKTIQDMNTTSKYFKLANLLLRQVLRCQSLQSLIQLNKSYTEQRNKSKGTAEQFTQSNSDFEQFLDRMRLLNQKHATRLQTYMKKSYWMDYMWTKSEKL